MSVPTLFGLCAAALVGLGLYGVITNPQPLRKLLAFNLIGNGVFLLFGAIARRGAAAGFAGDPVPHGLLITGIVVAFSATALAVALVLRLFHATGTATLADDQPSSVESDKRNPYEVGENSESFDEIRPALSQSKGQAIAATEGELKSPF
jgi:multicomponent Na+:H+ antiporter subunit C